MSDPLIDDEVGDPITYDDQKRMARDGSHDERRDLARRYCTSGLWFNALASVHLQRAQLDEAERAIERAMAIIETAHGPDHSSLAYSLQYLGQLRDKRGQPDAALAAYERMLAIMKKTYGPDHGYLNFALQSISQLHHKLGAGEYLAGEQSEEIGRRPLVRTANPVKNTQ